MQRALTRAQLVHAIKLEKMKCGRKGQREQFPLTPAYAMTIHKAQGLTLRRVAISMRWDGVVEAAAYVALSRATSLDGVFLLAFDEKCIWASEKVKQFYKEIKTGERRDQEARSQQSLAGSTASAHSATSATPRQEGSARTPAGSSSFERRQETSQLSSSFQGSAAPPPASAAPLPLPNLGNTCYFNAILQALLALPLPDFHRAIAAPQAEQRSLNTPDFALALVRVMRCCSGSSRPSPDVLRAAIAEVFANLRTARDGSFGDVHRQQDAEEFFHLVTAVEPFTSILAPIVEFRQRARYDCSNCRFTSFSNDQQPDRERPVSDSASEISLAPPLASASLDDLLRGYLRPFANSVTKRCACCDLNVEHAESWQVLTAPRVLLLQVKRFIWEADGTQRKNLLGVTAPPTLQLETHEQGRCFYDRCALVFHCGPSMSAGHYVAVVNHRGEWWSCSDHRLQRLIREEHVSEPPGCGRFLPASSHGCSRFEEFSPTLYLAFYVRRDE